MPETTTARPQAAKSKLVCLSLALDSTEVVRALQGSSRGFRRRKYSRLQKVGTWYKGEKSWDYLSYPSWGIGIRMLQVVGVYCR